MKVEFLAKFDKDLDKLTSQRVKDDIISAIENVGTGLVSYVKYVC
jgi:hypothetical protein